MITNELFENCYLCCCKHGLTVDLKRRRSVIESALRFLRCLRSGVVLSPWLLQTSVWLCWISSFVRGTTRVKTCRLIHSIASVEKRVFEVFRGEDISRNSWCFPLEIVLVRPSALSHRHKSVCFWNWSVFGVNIYFMPAQHVLSMLFWVNPRGG